MNQVLTGVLGGLGGLAMLGAMMYFYAHLGELDDNSGLGIGPGMPNAKAILKVKMFLEGLGLDPGQTYIDTNDNNIEWRGTIHGHPLRIKIYLIYDAEIDVKGPEELGDLPSLWWDESKVPQHGQPPAWDDTETQLVFVGKGVYLEGSGDSLDDDLRQFRRIPDAVSQALIEGMRQYEVEEVYFDPDGAVEVRFKNHLYEMKKPGERFVRMAEAAAAVVDAVQKGLPAPAPSSSGASASVEKVTCPYCGTVYLMRPVQPGQAGYGCPNCGAPPEKA